MTGGYREDLQELLLSRGIRLERRMAFVNEDLKVDGARLWNSLMEMAQIGPGAAGGSNRQALTDEDKAGRDLFVRWAQEAGCAVTIDEVGNIFARRAGLLSEAAPVLAGSHLDTQPTGGRFDGVYGVLAGLEVVRSLNDHGVTTSLPIEIAVWTNEEGCRFAPAMLGSGVVCGNYTREFADSRVDRDGKRFGDELDRIGYRGTLPASHHPIAAAFEAHIEQGPILEREGIQIGTVTGIQGAYWLELTFDGSPCHAGPTPMQMRKDPWRALTAFIDGAYAIADRNQPWGRVTFGDARVSPGSRNTSPARLTLWVDVRYPDIERLESMLAELEALAQNVCSARGIDLGMQRIWHMPPTQFDVRLVALVERVATTRGYSNKRMVSGAGHDSLHVAKIAPTAMIFVPCAGGLSHNEAEYASHADLAAGAEVLLHAILNVASR